jgi:hypothetical protein
MGSAYIVDNPWLYGFSWDFGPISRGIGVKKVVLREVCPYICVTADSLPLFLATFGPKMVAKALRGTSIKVQTDRVNRDLLKKDRTISDRDLMLRQVSSILLGVVTRTYWGGGNVPQVMFAGKLYPSKSAADAAAKVAEKNTAIESARSFLVDAQEAGIPAEVARTMARKQWPLAFETAADTEPEPDATVEYEDEEFDPTDDSEFDPSNPKFRA